jgi:hypothetical protein
LVVPLTHDCTVAVTSKVTKLPAADTVCVASTGPSDGVVTYITVDSFHTPPTACTSTGPLTSARLQYTRSVALVICAAVVPAGSTPRSNCSSVVYPPPTFRLLSEPAFTVGCALDTCASPTSVADCARIFTGAISSAASKRQTGAPDTLPLRSTTLNSAPSTIPALRCTSLPEVSSL